MTDTVRVRFAPSPTGYLHVGGARTALFNWLYARRSGGKFLLRIEDTDKARSSEAHIRVILDGLAWLGLDVDEEVVFQGAGVSRHQALADRLLDEGKAYEDEGAIRFRMPREEISWDDAVYGHIRFQGSDIKDWIILRSDRSPTYNFTVVADDIEMRITHVMRGDDHISNTPKQIAVYDALEREPPTFVHLPMIHGPDGKRLSKRHGATAVADYQQSGILPAAMRNFLALLGWNPGDERELFFTISELIEAFSVEKIQKKSAVFDITKLEWMNGQYISRTTPEQLFPLIEGELVDAGLDLDTIGRDRLLRATAVQSERARTTLELAHRLAIRFDASLIERDAKANKLISKDPTGFRSALSAAAQRLSGIEDSQWEAERLETELRSLANELELAPGKVFQPIRVAVTGNTVSEPVNVLLEVVGKQESLARMEAAKGWEPTA
ncbi:MAG: glutamate--tRNA ligase [Gemmatimonadales bacterium]|nr:glutamate--tRNA ligase [Gemmatimonadales bacterium]NIN12374.1 glutamate--tRNA ligase [Gemmatimonadales bacterium]NIN48912.1 glutamate--tRNA ligase [Gemmatimonadales bacterium]NIP06376.1 glutamate--tRNA ligase [Gemmatimonadales bacterium]NIR00749.1 glutamate--tRNA ligase [Gemmatimonadales bacterium]